MRLPPHIVAIQLVSFIPVGTPMIIVAATDGCRRRMDEFTQKDRGGTSSRDEQGVQHDANTGRSNGLPTPTL